VIDAQADLERIATLGLLAMFGSVPLMLPVGWLIARRAGFEAGVSAVLLVFGIAAAATAVRLAIHVHVQSALVADPRQANALIGVFGAFGGFGLLAGAFFAVARARRSRAAATLDERTLSPRRQRLGQGFTIAGNLSMVGCALTAAFADMSAVRSGVLVFGGAAAACVSFALALVARRALALDTALILAIVGGGTALAALSLWYLG
jgi:hypothetical protein